MKITRRKRVHFEIALARENFFFLRNKIFLFRNGNARSVGKIFDRPAVIEVFDPHDEGDDVPARAAAEAVKILFGENDKGGGALTVKGTAGGKITSRRL